MFTFETHEDTLHLTKKKKKQIIDFDLRLSTADLPREVFL